jgi:hypoxia up-regulated 1
MCVCVVRVACMRLYMCVRADACVLRPIQVWRKKTHRFPVTVSDLQAMAGDVRPLTGQEKSTSKSLLQRFIKYDASRRALADVKNKLESFIYGTKEKLESTEYSDVTTKEQKFQVIRACDAAAEWLAEHVNDEIASLFRDQLTPLEQLMDDIVFVFITFRIRISRAALVRLS